MLVGIACGAACGGKPFRADPGASDASAVPPSPPQPLPDGAPPGARDGGLDATPPGKVTSCATLLRARPELRSQDNYYDIDLGGLDAGLTKVWCDMTVDGGGWLLLGRSVANLFVPDFGWTREHGTVTDDSQPYSLGDPAAQVAFTEILFGTYANGKQWGTGAIAYKLGVPSDFRSARMTSAFQASGGPKTVFGTCAPNGGPSMLRYVGHTNNFEVFFFRDNATEDRFGLFSDGFETAGTDCNYSGLLDSRQGMLFVR